MKYVGGETAGVMGVPLNNFGKGFHRGVLLVVCIFVGQYFTSLFVV